MFEAGFKSRTRCACLLLLVMFALRGTAGAQGYSRAGRIEAYLGGQYQSAVSSMLKNEPVELDLENTGLIVSGFGYHLNDHFCANLNLAFGTTRMRLDGPLADDTWEQDAYLFNGNLNMDYNILKGRFTPLITAGIGWNMFQAYDYSEPPEYVCVPGFPYWWCTYGYPIETTWQFAANVGAGFRWEINDNLFIKALASTTYTQFSDAQDPFFFIQGTLSIGWIY